MHTAQPVGKGDPLDFDPACFKFQVVEQKPKINTIF